MGFIDMDPIMGAFSNSSSTHLMTDALLTPSPSQNQGAHSPTHTDDRTTRPLLNRNTHCWKCKLEALVGKLDKLRRRSASCLWFLCCGFEADDDGTTYAPRHAGSGEHVQVIMSWLEEGEWRTSGSGTKDCVRQYTTSALFEREFACRMSEAGIGEAAEGEY
jgi:hypothetical protein